MFETRQEGYANLALEALELATELRREYGLPETIVKPLNPDWNAKQYLVGKKKEIEAYKERRASANQRMWSSLESKELSK